MSSTTAQLGDAKTPAPAERKATSEDVSPTSVLGFTESEMKTHVGEGLRCVMKGISAPFTCGGSIELETGKVPHVTLLESNETIAFDVPPTKPVPPEKKNAWRNPDSVRQERLEAQPQILASLTSKMPQAAFGKGKETVYDDSVRKALQLPASQFEIDIPEDKLDEILADIKAKLRIKTDLVAERYSINAYEKGGKFAKHKDTPRGDDMLGTLVLCLPSLFRGGGMTVSMGDESHEYFQLGRWSWESANNGHPSWWDTYSNKDPDFSKIPWCAFFADVDHEIHQVTSGLRVTVAYLLRRKDHQPASAILPRTLKEQEQTVSLQDSFSQALRSENFLSAGGTVGFPCQHLYTNQQLFSQKGSSSDTPLTTKAINNLKGRDHMVAQVAASLGLSVRLVPYLGHDYSQDGMGDYKLSKFPKKKRAPRRMSDETIERFFDTVETKQNDEIADLWVLDFDEAASSKAGSTEWNAEGYFGNEASGIDFYVKAALIVDVTEFSETRGDRVVTEKASKKRKKAS